jgi:FkbM family methyltransferase
MIISDEIYLKEEIEIKKELLDFFNVDASLTIFDIGTCDGLDAIKYRRLFPKSTLYAFEPLPANFILLTNNIEKYNCLITPVNLALSNAVGKAEFHVSSGRPQDISSDVDWDFGNKSSSLLPPNKASEVLPWLEFQEKIEVETSTLDMYCGLNSINGIDFIHMDVQGAEMLVLEGASGMLSNIKMIWMEVENIELYKNQPLKLDVERFLSENGFTKIKDTVNHIAGDQLWVNLNYFPKKKLTHTLWKIYAKIFSK